MNSNPPFRWDLSDWPRRAELVACRPLAAAEPNQTVLSVKGRPGSPSYLVLGLGRPIILAVGGPCPVRTVRNPNHPHSPTEPRIIKSALDLLRSAVALAKHHQLHRPPTAHHGAQSNA